MENCSVRLSSSRLRSTIVQSGCLDNCSLEVEWSSCKIKQVPLKGCQIQISVDLPLALGDPVMRMGTSEWRGHVLQIDDNSVLVKWQGRQEEWVDLHQVYPLDDFGRPRIPEKQNNLLDIGRRARASLETKLPNQNPSDPEQLLLF